MAVLLPTLRILKAVQVMRELAVSSFHSAVVLPFQDIPVSPCLLIGVYKWPLIDLCLSTWLCRSVEGSPGMQGVGFHGL